MEWRFHLRAFLDQRKLCDSSVSEWFFFISLNGSKKSIQKVWWYLVNPNRCPRLTTSYKRECRKPFMIRKLCEGYRDRWKWGMTRMKNEGIIVSERRFYERGDEMKGREKDEIGVIVATMKLSEARRRARRAPNKDWRRMAQRQFVVEATHERAQ